MLRFSGLLAMPRSARRAARPAAPAVLAAALLAALTGGGLPAHAVAAAEPSPAAAPAAPWQQAERLRADLLAAQSALITAGPAQAARRVARARARYTGELRAGVLAAGADADTAARGALAGAARAARAGDASALAAARGGARAALLRGAYAAALAAAGRSDPAAARSWLRLRDVRTGARRARAGADATSAVAGLAAGRLEPRATRAAIARDLLDAYQARLRELLDGARGAIERGLPVRAAAAAGQAEGYFLLLRLRYAEDRGELAAQRAAGRFAQLRRAAVREQARATQVAAAAATLDGFTAAPSTDAEPARRDALTTAPALDGSGPGLALTLTVAVAAAMAFVLGSRLVAQKLRARRPRRPAAAQNRGSTASSPAHGSSPESREPTTTQREPASVMAASAPPSRGA